jgi:FkbM family methyltransferase
MPVTDILLAIKRRFHPVFYLRGTAVGRVLIKAMDFPVWLSIPKVAFKVRGLSITHRALFSVPFQEPNAEALAVACVTNLAVNSFWDVGANIGYYTWLLKTVRPDLEVVMFEPIAENVRLIRQTIAANALGASVHLIPAAVSDRSGQGVIHRDSLTTETSSLEKDETFQETHFGIKAESREVQLVSIDDERTRRPHPIDFMKVDVEGHEESALRGAMRAIESDQPIIFIECHGGRRPFADLDRMGYRFIDADQLTLAPPFATTSSIFFAFPPRFADAVDDLLREVRQR